MGETGDRSAILMPSCLTLSQLFLFVYLMLPRGRDSGLQPDHFKFAQLYREWARDGRYLTRLAGKALKAPVGCVQQCLVLRSGPCFSSIHYRV
jgi:hypothetical protein